MDREKNRKKQSRTGKKKLRASRAKAGKKGKRRGIDHARLMPAMNNVLRRHILRTLHDSEEPLSPCRLSRMLGEPVSSLSYHVSALRDHGAIELVAEKQVRGTVAHYYASRVANDDLVGKLLEATRKSDEAELPIPD